MGFMLVPDEAEDDLEESFKADASPVTSDQPEFDGMPVREERFALKSVSALYTDKRPKMGSHVDGTYAGRVKGYYYVEGVLTTLIEVLDAELG